MVGGRYFALAMCLLMSLQSHVANSQDGKSPYVRLAELEIDPAQMDNFKVAIKEGIEAAIREEPGVLALHAVAMKDRPTTVRVFEVYANVAACATHRETPHFKRFLSTTNSMVKARKLMDADAIALGAKKN